MAAAAASVFGSVAAAAAAAAAAATAAAAAVYIAGACCFVCDGAQEECNKTLQLDFVQEHLVKHDQKEAAAISGEIDKAKKTVKAFESELSVFRKAVRAPAKGGGKGGRAAGRGGQKKVRKLPKDEDINMAFVEAELPPGARIYQDDFNSRFLCFF